MTMEVAVHNTISILPLGDLATIESENPIYRERIQMNDERLALFHNLVNLAAVDYKFTEEEIGFLVNRAEAWDIPSDEFETALAGISTGQIEVTIPEDHGQRVSMLKEMIRLMAVDGEMAEMEKRLCASASAQMDFTEVQFSEILEEVIRERS